MFGFKKKEYKLICKAVKQNIVELALVDEKHKKLSTYYLDLHDVIPYANLSPKVVTKEVAKSSIWHVLAIMPTTNKQTVNTAFKKMSFVYHPDHGGSAEAFQVLKEARDKALAKCK